MRLVIAGGVGESGRNCFLVERERDSFLVDCGRMAGKKHPYPDLTPEQICRVRYVFLTHSHTDHTGALPWLYENGFSGEVIASRQTFSQLKEKPQRQIMLENFSHPDIRVEWGRSGHCAGSVWYRFEIAGKTLLFSGDYTESGYVYQCDPIRGQKAHIAVLDSAYGSDERDFESTCGQIEEILRRCAEERRSVVLPVPQYGRGLDLCLVASRVCPKTPIFADEQFLVQKMIQQQNEQWIRPEAMRELSRLRIQMIADRMLPYGIYFLCDSQLYRRSSLNVVYRIVARKGLVLLTGRVDAKSGSDQLLREGKARLYRWSVHCTDREREKIEGQNDFRCVIPYHTAEHPVIQKSLEL